MNRINLIYFLLENNKPAFKSELKRVYPRIIENDFYQEFERLDNEELTNRIDLFVSSNKDKSNKFKLIQVEYNNNVENFTTNQATKDYLRTLDSNQPTIATKGLGEDLNNRVETNWIVNVGEVLTGSSKTDFDKTLIKKEANSIVIIAVVILVLGGLFLIIKK